jgi:conjugal transfer/entry exclusion protein
MTDWLEMTEAQKDEANEIAYAGACDRLRSAQSNSPFATMADVRSIAATQLAADIAEAQREIAQAAKARATKQDKRFAEAAKRRIAAWSLVEGFIWDAEI